MEQARMLFGKDFFSIVPGEAALIVVDMQNAFLEEGSPYEVPEGRSIIPRTEELVNFCRQRRIPIIWTRSDHTFPHAGLLVNKFPPIKNDRVLWKGTHSHEYYPKVSGPQEGEYEVIKHKYDAFFETDLDAILRNLDVKTVLITGVDTCVCCESTARSAFFRDYQVVFISDGNASYDPGAHRATLTTIGIFFGRVASTDEAIAEMSGR